MALHQLATTQRKSAPLALLAIDLDGFKAVNDQLGHAARDAVLKTAAARIADDEFAVLLGDTNLAGAQVIAHKLLAVLAAPYADVASPLSASIGIADFPESGVIVPALFDSADGTKSLQLRLSQLETEGRVRIISRPAVATTNNKTAQIKSVEKVRVRLPNGGLSVATGSGAAANGAGSIATEVIEAGIILDVTPQASPDYFVLLDIRAKSSSFSSRESGDGIPNEIERSASSTVLVSSGQTFALGGIYKISDTDRISGVPFLKDIPVLGHLFRRSVLDNSDEELLFFITPRIVEGSFDDASMRAAS